MNAIELMVHEHTYIKRVLKVTRKVSLDILNGEEVDYKIFYKVIDFVRNYADKHHHSKEEDILFKRMAEDLVDKIGTGPIQGMFVEHDQGRLFILNLENAVNKVLEGDQDARLDVIGNAIAYTDLLNRHIDKEDNVLYVFGQNQLSEEALADVELKCNEVETEATKNKLQVKYITIVEELEALVKTEEGK